MSRIVALTTLLAILAPTVMAQGWRGETVSSTWLQGVEPILQGEHISRAGIEDGKLIYDRLKDSPQIEVFLQSSGGLEHTPNYLCLRVGDVLLRLPQFFHPMAASARYGKVKFSGHPPKMGIIEGNAVEFYNTEARDFLGLAEESDRIRILSQRIYNLRVPDSFDTDWLRGEPKMVNVLSILAEVGGEPVYVEQVLLASTKGSQIIWSRLAVRRIDVGFSPFSFQNSRTRLSLGDANLKRFDSRVYKPNMLVDLMASPHNNMPVYAACGMALCDWAWEYDEEIDIDFKTRAMAVLTEAESRLLQEASAHRTAAAPKLNGLPATNASGRLAAAKEIMVVCDWLYSAMTPLESPLKLRKKVRNPK